MSKKRNDSRSHYFELRELSELRETLKLSSHYCRIGAFLVWLSGRIMEKVAPVFVFGWPKISP